MTDLELTEKCAKWLGIYWKTSISRVYIIKDIIAHENKPDDYLYASFDPLHDWNDLMIKVVPKLPLDYWIEIRPGDREFKINYDEKYDYSTHSIITKTVTEGIFPDEFPRVILELVAELYEKEQNHDT